MGGAEFVAVGGALAGVGQLAQWVAPAGTVQTCSARGRACTIYSATPVAPSASAPMQTTPVAQARRAQKTRLAAAHDAAGYDETRPRHWMQTCTLDKSMFSFLFAYPKPDQTETERDMAIGFIVAAKSTALPTTVFLAQASTHATCTFPWPWPWPYIHNTTVDVSGSKFRSAVLHASQMLP